MRLKVKGQFIYMTRRDRLVVLENYNSYILRQRGAKECFTKLGKSGKETLEMSEKPMKQKQ